MIRYHNSQAVSDIYERKSKHFKDVLIARAFKELCNWSESEISDYVASHGYHKGSKEDDLKNAKILIIQQYDSMDYQTLLKMYNYGKLGLNHWFT